MVDLSKWCEAKGISRIYMRYPMAAISAIVVGILIVRKIWLK